RPAMVEEKIPKRVARSNKRSTKTLNPQSNISRKIEKKSVQLTLSFLYSDTQNQYRSLRELFRP
ncbi:hypothetical protein AKJ62_03930, partial [candidate division MSBL1 archaeon SCGC-AAA259D14]